MTASCAPLMLQSKPKLNSQRFQIIGLIPLWLWFLDDLSPVGLEIISLNCMNEVQEPSHRRGRKLEKSTFAWNSTRRVLDFILF
ncbi:Proton-Coupled Amino Acid Transporter 4 [Manis pentadactyla]|nr:Proton-Coupled Amino Acid Transporter 4 [Manis pentadactyla]